MTFFVSRFLPPPIALVYNPSISLAPLDALKTHFASLFQSWALFDQSSLAYDNACPSIQNVLSLRTCDQCGSYYGSQALLKNHSSIHKTKKQHRVKAKKSVVLPERRSFGDCEWRRARVDESRRCRHPTTRVLWACRSRSSSAGFHAWWKLFNAVGIIFRWLRKKKKNNEPATWHNIKNRKYNKYFIYTELARFHWVKSVIQA